MNAVIYHSNTGECKRIAEHIANDLGFPCLDIASLQGTEFDGLVIVFPVHCQSIPTAIRPIFSTLRARKTVLIAAYGKMSHGNVLYECQSRYGISPVAAAYLPTKHSYLPDDKPFEGLDRLGFVKDALEHGEKISLPRSFKNPLASLFPSLRSRLGVKLIRDSRCNSCGICRDVCQNKKCVRCLKCVASCPQNAISIRLTLPMRLYLKLKREPKIEIFS